MDILHTKLNKANKGQGVVKTTGNRKSFTGLFSAVFVYFTFINVVRYSMH